MRRHMAVATVSVMMVCLASGVLAATRPARQARRAVSGDVKTLAAGGNAFALNLYAQVREPGKNLFFSPFSISTALAMTHAGARGETAAQMAEVLHFDLPPEKLHGACKALIEDLNARQRRGAYELVVANALWGQEGYAFLQEFLGLTREAYGAGLRELDFQADPEAARQVINKWVEEKTREKIKDLIAQGVLKRETRLVLTNAIYFLGTWASKFRKEDTQEAPFTLADGTKVNVPLMFQSDRFPYMEGDGFQALQMPYRGGDLSMLLLLPRAVDGIPAMEEKLTQENLDEWLGRLARKEGRVWVPRFRMTCTFTLNDALKQMGMADLFSGDKADLSGMNGRRDLFVSTVVHKAFVDVNEEGTEAAAATAVMVEMTSAMPEREEPFEFRADRPFIFVIRDRRSGAILFLGRVTDPR